MARPAAGRIPELEQVAGRTSRGGDDRVAGARLLVEHADQLALAHGLAFVVRVDLALHLFIPGKTGGRDLVQVGRPRLNPRRLGALVQGTQGFASIGRDRQVLLACAHRGCKR